MPYQNQPQPCAGVFARETAVTLIAESANSVSAASAQLATASEQSGEATSQIATTIQQAG